VIKYTRVCPTHNGRAVGNRPPIRVSVWGWEDIEEHASKYDMAKVFDPTFNPFVEQGFEALTVEVQDMGSP
jgi:hypothetical protein